MIFSTHIFSRCKLIASPFLLRFRLLILHHLSIVTGISFKCWSTFYLRLSKLYVTVFFKTRGHLLVWAPPRLASSGLAWPCLAMPCHALSCLAWVWMWRFFVQYKKWDSYGGVVLMRFSRYLQSDYSRLITIWAKCIYILIFCAKTSFYKRYLLMAWYLVYPMILGYFQIARLMPGKYGGHFADDIFKLILFIKNVV